MTQREPSGSRAGDEQGFSQIEGLVAVVMFSIGTLGMAGLTAQVGLLTTQAAVATDQTFAAEQAFADLREQSFDAVTSGSKAVQVGNQTYTVELDVSALSPDTKQVVAVVAGAAGSPPDTFRTVLHRPTGYPTSP